MDLHPQWDSADTWRAGSLPAHLISRQPYSPVTRQNPAGAEVACEIGLIYLCSLHRGIAPVVRPGSSAEYCIQHVAGHLGQCSGASSERQWLGQNDAQS